MPSEIRVNQIQNRSGLSTVTFSDTGVVISGVTTVSGNLNVTGSLSGSGSNGIVVGTGASISSPATNTLTLGTNNVESVRLDSSGNFNLVNTAGIMTAFKYETPALINNHFKSQSTTAGAYVRMYAAAGTGQWDIYNNGANLRFSDNASSGNIQMDRPLSMNSQNIIMSSGYGIDFSATANSSGTMTSELLSDYEEGTWTPTPNYLGTIAYNSRQGTYIKVGNLVTVKFSMSFTTNNTTQDTTALDITGLPFTSNDISSPSAILTERVYTSVQTTSSNVTFFVWATSGATSLRVLENTFNSGIANATYYASAQRSSAKSTGVIYMHGTCQYIT